MRRLLWSTCIGVLGLVVLSGARAELVIYRCTDAAGAVTVQNDQRCPTGSRQERRVIDDAPVAPPPPAPVPPPAPPPMPPTLAPLQPVVDTPAADPMPAAVAAPPVELVPPPALFQCRTWNDELYLTERDTPARRCAPLRTRGLAGGGGVGAACEERQDRCEPVAEAALCERWRERLTIAQGAERFGMPTREGETARDVERIERLLAQSTCAATQ
ncbi:DUF4124 domain-containing protein [Lysobacter sp. A3-1-A15]|uniref:DUF4124 domain-containing protein n=1 Tax=Novilysobacter viscosus TaxID=3098602 RepID=UPI002EDA0802